jgi:hypothetical protein
MRSGAALQVLIGFSAAFWKAYLKSTPWKHWQDLLTNLMLIVLPFLYAFKVR